MLNEFKKIDLKPISSKPFFRVVGAAKPPKPDDEEHIGKMFFGTVDKFTASCLGGDFRFMNEMMGMSWSDFWAQADFESPPFDLPENADAHILIERHSEHDLFIELESYRQQGKKLDLNWKVTSAEPRGDTQRRKPYVIMITPKGSEIAQFFNRVNNFENDEVDKKAQVIQPKPKVAFSYKLEEQGLINFEHVSSDEQEGFSTFGGFPFVDPNALRAIFTRSDDKRLPFDKRAQDIRKADEASSHADNITSIFQGREKDGGIGTYFQGTIKGGSAMHRSGTISSNEAWEELWSDMDISPPCTLPPKSSAIYFMEKHSTYDTSVSLAHVPEINHETNVIKWDIKTSLAGEQGDTKGSFFILIAPDYPLSSSQDRKHEPLGVIDNTPRAEP